VSQLPTPKRVLLVYAKPSGSPPFGGPNVIYRSTPNGRNPVRLVIGDDPVVSPDGRWVAFWRGESNGPGRLFVISTSGGQPRALPADSNGEVVWSWDSRLVAMGSLGRATVVDVRRGTARRFKVPQGSGNYSFSPDGKTLAFSHSTGRGANILILRLTDGRVTSLTSDDRSYAPLWGPQGIAFERFTDRCCHGDVWLMNAQGGDVHQLTHTHAGIYPAAWSASGTRLLAAYPAAHNGKLYAVDVKTGNARALTGFVGDLFPGGLSRDGTTVLANIGCGGTTSPYGMIETIPFTGGRPKVIVRGPCRATWTA
jgi:Tol biopolymer transport system component